MVTETNNFSPQVGIFLWCFLAALPNLDPMRIKTWVRRRIPHCMLSLSFFCGSANIIAILVYCMKIHQMYGTLIFLLLPNFPVAEATNKGWQLFIVIQLGRPVTCMQGLGRVHSTQRLLRSHWGWRRPRRMNLAKPGWAFTLFRLFSILELSKGHSEGREQYYQSDRTHFWKQLGIDGTEVGLFVCLFV